MRWSVRLGSPFGIPVYLHSTFLLFLVVLGLALGLRSGSVAAGLAGVGFVVAVFGCVVLHELGHALAARRFGIGTRDVTLLPIGGLARLERMPDDPRHELWIALAGPAVNLVLAGLLGIWVFLSGSATAIAGVGIAGASFAGQLMAINIGLLAFNMLPAFPMDGGRVLRALLARLTSHDRATETAVALGRLMAVAFAVAGLFLNPMLILIAAFVWFGAGREAQLARSLAAGVRRTAIAEARPDGIVFSGPDDGGFRPRRRVYRVGPWLVYREEGGGK